jgi:DNA-binding transcriptional LysR family regulator
VAKRKRSPPSRSPASAAGEAGAKNNPLGSRINLQRLALFVSVAETGSMSAAAEKFGMTQPAVSQAIAKLEAVIGIELFDRSMRPPVITLRGSMFLEDARVVVESIRRLESGLRFDSQAQLPVLRVGMLNSFATTLGPAMIKKLQDTAAEWYLDTGLEATRMAALLDRRVDFIITADEVPPPPGVTVLPLFSEAYRIVLPRSGARVVGKLADVLSDMSMIRFGRDTHLLSRMENALSDAGIKPQQRYHFDTIEGAAGMVKSDLGWCLLPPLAIFRMLERGEPIACLRFPGIPIRRTISVVSREHEAPHLADRIFATAAELLEEVFLPSLKRLMPDAEDDVEIYFRGRRGGGRK